ncbi:uncharacterized protein LOC110452159 [Mizuhopecten yessoensis]|uniref:RBR-type E3 ubiquitin transferase n=1 Tax=Mizuhopecten yessoensis TaxID=6573 RepID=A0A210QK77_MIZYE|nr:uncharacterized protein LOC110452159 [Mizuhopecten yessoensis]XP_021356198.1 uncharacterized protein LOC110452159 [Mizuhopecten yessoensis]OWF49154.1 E3 ubiquitin-protein ligase [Mizuhopecten yessoensis]
MESSDPESSPSLELERKTKKSSGSLQNLSDNGQECGKPLVVTCASTSLTDLTGSSSTEVQLMEKNSAGRTSELAEQYTADVNGKEQSTLLSLARQYQKTANKPSEFTEIQNPLQRHRRNYKVTKRSSSGSKQKIATSTKSGSDAVSVREQQGNPKNSRSTTAVMEQQASNTDETSTTTSTRRGVAGSKILTELYTERRHAYMFRPHACMFKPSVFTISEGAGSVPERRSPVDFASDLNWSAESTSTDSADFYENLMDMHIAAPFDDDTYLDTHANMPNVHVALDLNYPQLDNDDDWLYVRDLDFRLQNMSMDLSRDRASSSLYPRADLITRTECEVCYERTSVRKRLCCDFPVCEPCMEKYVEEKVNNGGVTIQCIGPCESLVHRDEILSRLSVEMKEKYYKFLVDANQDPMVKTCPQCSTIQNITKEELRAAKKRVKGFRTNVTCPKCDLVWCFSCHAPAHEGVTCKDFKKGDKLLKSWARIKTTGRELNAQKCPRCKVFIERKGGCDHMTCKQCGTSFCYRCGERYITTSIVTKLIGDHHGKFSPFGCKYNLLPNEPCARKLIRGSVLGAKVLGGILLGGLLVAAGAILVGTSFIVFPAYRGYRYHQQRKYRKRLRTFRHINLSRHFLTPPEIPQLTVSNIRREDAQSQNSSIFGSVFDEMDNNSTNDESPESGAEHDPSREVEVWVHCHHQNIPTDIRQEVEGLENTAHLDDKNTVTQTTAKLSKDQNQGDVLYVKTTYANEDHERSSCRKGSSEIQDNNENQKSEESVLNTKSKNDSKNRPSDLNGESSDSDSTENQSNKNKEKDGNDEDTETGDENSTTQGCFVRIFGKKLPVVWEKDRDGEMIKTIDSKQKEHSGSLEKKKVQGHSSIAVDGTLEKKKIQLPSSITLDGGSLDRNLKKHVSNVGGVKLVTQPDIVTCVLQSKQANQLTGKCDKEGSVNGENLEEGEITLEVDPYFGIVSPDNYETTL